MESHEVYMSPIIQEIASTLSLCNLPLLEQHSIWGASGLTLSNPGKSKQIKCQANIQHPVTSNESNKDLEDNVLAVWVKYV